ncbi:MAG: hypothetical protein U5Q44_06425 [Dehalococcoidia bacterium]|nr:hypothetical protein [Dehalococcoidia bacterium]
MVMRIRVEDLGDEVRERLARGEPVEIERDGEVVARIPPKQELHEGRARGVHRGA